MGTRMEPLFMRLTRPLDGRAGRRPLLFPADWVVIAYFGILTLVVLARWGWMRRPLGFTAFHLLVIGTLIAVAWADRRFDNRFWRFVHYWLPVGVVLTAFQELQYLIPQVHSFADRRFDYALDGLDRRWFGDVEAFCRTIASRAGADLMALCYVSYYILPIVLGGFLYARGRFDRLRESAAVLCVGWFLSYLGYFAVPALGPYRVIDGIREPALEGWLWAGRVHRVIAELEWEMPDAFPSGHALIAMLVVVLAWRHARGLLWALLPVALGLIASTLYLRYHYVVDLVASAAIVPVAVVLGRVMARAWETASAERT
ncbi:MAG: phosphatase PAP2 family protein [Planctomycetes bacterium]|nr:phosphatase PAP2 family protein [Planctomycetota bacterium]